MTLDRPNEPINGHGLIPAMGIAQIISWGTLYYTIAVLGESMRAELGVSRPFLYGAFTCGLLISGFAAPVMGRKIDQFGGRVPLTLGSLVAALAMGLLAIAPHGSVLALGWLLAGAAMAMTLYDPAFASLHRLRPETYRRAVTALTLFGGFASTVFWPLSNYLEASFGWRGGYVIFALLHLLVCLPLHWVFLPKEAELAPHADAESTSPGTPVGIAAFYWLAAAFALASFLVGGLAVHLIDIMKSGGLSAADAVWIGACIGPMQVAGRVLEFVFARRTRVVHVAYFAFGLLLIAMILLAFIGTTFTLGVLFAMLYGMANGILTIVRGVAPPEILGGTKVGTLLGKLGRPALIAKALAPLGIALLVSGGLARGSLIGVFAVVAALAGGCFFMAATRRPIEVAVA